MSVDHSNAAGISEYNGTEWGERETRAHLKPAAEHPHQTAGTAHTHLR